MTATRTAPISVLLSVYIKERPEWMRLALESISKQTLTPRELVLVCDGPIEPAHDEVIEEFTRTTPIPVVKVLRQDVNRGLAAALNIGLAECTQEFIARMDTDDFAAPEKFERQMAVFAQQPELDLSATWQGEFSETPDRLEAVKKTPETHEEIIAGLKWRNIISHPSIVARRAMFERVGGYRSDFGLLEDYDIWVRMAQAGAKFQAVQEPLCLVRIAPEQRVRRGGWNYVRKEWRFRNELRRVGFLKPHQFLISSGIYTVFRLAPPGLKSLMYRGVRRPTGTTTEPEPVRRAA